ncbi:MAG: hypothetical protein LIP01_08945 [Tannerellaceae bacterium]|nr:hypothetical protein [Tannerellaceae bacterium]
MYKKTILCLGIAALLNGLPASAQQCELPLTVAVPQTSTQISREAGSQLANKLKQIVVKNGLHSDDFSSRFMLTADLHVLTKDVLAGPPTKVSQDLEITFYIMDITGDKIYDSFSMESKGVGENETKSFIDAIRQINIRNRNLDAFINSGKEKILNYYDTHYGDIIKRAQALALTKQFDQAFYEVASIPECCKGYDEALEAGLQIYELYKDELCVQNLAQAKAIWMSEQNADGAKMAAVYLSRILPDAGCYPEATALYNEIKDRIDEDWQWEKKQYEDNVEKQKRIISAIRDIGVAYGNGQQPNTTNLNLIR